MGKTKIPAINGVWHDGVKNGQLSLRCILYNFQFLLALFLSNSKRKLTIIIVLKIPYHIKRVPITVIITGNGDG